MQQQGTVRDGTRAKRSIPSNGQNEAVDDDDDATAKTIGQRQHP